MEHFVTLAERTAHQVSERVKECGVTVVWLCEKTGIPRSTMVRRLSGHSAFNLNELDAIAKALHTTVEHLVASSTQAVA